MLYSHDYNTKAAYMLIDLTPKAPIPINDVINLQYELDAKLVSVVTCNARLIQTQNITAKMVLRGEK